MTLTEIIKALEEAKANGIFDLYSESITAREAIHLANDISLLRTALACLNDLKEHGCNQFFNGSISK